MATGLMRIHPCGVLACVIGLAWSVAGCGGETLPQPDVAALNAELAQAESRLAERLAALEAGAVEEACQFSASALEEGERWGAGLPDGAVEERVALAEALARFREGAEELAGEVEAAGRAETEARADAVAALEALRETRRRFEEEVEPGLPEWAGKVRETTAQLSAWREQRLEKMEDRQFATFPAFHEAASVRYREWTAWTERAGTMCETALGDLRPAVLAAAERMAARTEAATGARARVEEGIGKLRAMPVSKNLVATARREAIAAYNGTIHGAAVAMAGMEKATAGCPEDVRKRAEGLLESVADLETAVEGLHADIREQMDADSVPAAMAAAADARDIHGELAGGVAEFEAVRNRIRQAWAPLGEQVQTAADAAAEIQKMARTDESALARDWVTIASLCRKIEEADIRSGCERLVAFRGEAEARLSAAENGLAAAHDAFRASMTTGARKAARISLGNLHASLGQKPAPGWTRPERKVSAIRAKIERFLEGMDSMSDEEFMEEDTRLSEEVGKTVDDIVDRTVWTPGARHPDHPHIHASDEERTWTNDPGYEFVELGTSNLSVRWAPGAWHPDHPNVMAGQAEGTWVPKPGYKARRKGDLDPVWTPGLPHPIHPHVHASDSERTWTNDPGYEFVDPSADSTNFAVRWKPGYWPSAHPNVTAGQTEGTWVPEPGYKARWNGDMDPRWTAGTRHPTKPHVFATDKEHTWDADPGYWFLRPGTNCDLVVQWTPGRRHPDYRGIEAAEQEGQWNILPGWTWVHPGTSDLRTRWVPGTPKPGAPHVHASDTEGQWTPDSGYRFKSMADDGDFSVEWVGR